MSLEKSKNALEEKRKMMKQKICIKKDQHVYNNCYELRPRAINKFSQLSTISILYILSACTKNCYKNF